MRVEPGLSHQNRNRDGDEMAKNYVSRLRRGCCGQAWYLKKTKMSL